MVHVHVNRELLNPHSEQLHRYRNRKFLTQKFTDPLGHDQADHGNNKHYKSGNVCDVKDKEEFDEILERKKEKKQWKEERRQDRKRGRKEQR